jgi:hypothetical protein
MVIDFGYSLNEVLTEGMQRGENQIWVVINLVYSVCMIVLAVGMDIYIWRSYDSLASHIIVIVTLSSSVVLTFLSITNLVPAAANRGSLLASSTFAAFAQWVALQTISGQHTKAAVPWIQALILCSIFLALSVFDVTFNRAKQRDGTSYRILPGTEEEGEEKNIQTGEFVILCVANALSCVYLVFELVPHENRWSFVSGVAALIIVVIMYAWSLVAPAILTNRTFAREPSPCVISLSC